MCYSVTPLVHTTGYTAASLAAATHVSTLKVLAKRGADLSVHSPAVGTLLHAAVKGALQGDKLEVFKYLHTNSQLFAHAHLQVDDKGSTALHTACASGKADLVRCVIMLSAWCCCYATALAWERRVELLTSGLSTVNAHLLA